MIEIEVEVKIGSWAPPTDAMQKIDEMLADAEKFQKINNKVSVISQEQKEITSWLGNVHKGDILFSVSVNKVINERIDSSLKEDSFNAVQNKVVKAKFDEIEEELSFLENDVNDINKDIDSLQNELSDAETEIENIKNDVEENTLSSHRHNNSEVLGALSENENGNLTYKGEEIKGGSIERPTAEITVDAFDAGTLYITEGFNKDIALFVSSDMIPEGSEIADVKFTYGDYSEISIKELYTVDGMPYFYAMGKTYATGNGTFVASIGYGGSTLGHIAEFLNSYEPVTVKVIYYTD